MIIDKIVYINTCTCITGTVQHSDDNSCDDYNTGVVEALADSQADNRCTLKY